MTTKIFPVRMPDDWSWSFEHGLLSRLAACEFNVGLELLDVVERAEKWGYGISSNRFLSVFEVLMSRKSKSNGSTTGNGSDGGSGARSDAKWVWANCRLSNEDIAELERSDATLEYLATSLIALANDGFGVSIKTVDSGKSKCVTINRPDFPNRGVTVGVSSFGGSVRDAALAVLYKLDTYGGGDFTGFDLESDTESSRPRFR